MPGVSAHLRSNAVGYVAVFIALSGTTYAAVRLPKDSVRAKQIAANAVGTSEARDDALTGADVNEGSLGQVPSAQAAGVADSAQSAQSAAAAEIANVAGSAQNANLLDDLNSTDFLRSNASAGGDLSGNYPNPDIDGGAVTEGKIAPGAVTPDKLGTIPAVRTFIPAEPVGASCSFDPLIATNTMEPVPFFSETFDTASMHSTPGCAAEHARLTAPQPGVYVVSAGGVWEGNATGIRELTLRSNGSALLASDERPALAVNLQQEVSTIVALGQGDYVELVAFQSSGTNLRLFSDARTYVSMAWIGPG